MSYEYQDMVLGAVIRYHKEHWNRVKPYFKPEYFLEVERIKIAKAILHAIDTNQPICTSVITSIAGGEVHFLVDRLYDYAPIEMNVEWMARQLHDMYHIKQNVPSMNEALQKIINAKIGDKTEVLLSEVKNISEKMYNARSDDNSFKDMAVVLEETFEMILNKISGKEDSESQYIKSNIEKVDSVIRGFKGGRLYVLAARPSVGKTSFATHLCLEAMKSGKKPLFFSNEMDGSDLMHKMICNMSNIPANAMDSGNLSDLQLDKLNTSVKELSKMGIIIDEKSGWSIDSLISAVYRHQNRKRCDIVFVDYIQQVKVHKSQTKTEQVNFVSDALKKLSRDLNVPVVALAQINREAEKTNGKDVAPSLIHIKDSGSIEQDADVVMILHRPEGGSEDNHTKIELKIAKNRYGDVGTINLKFHHKICKYTQR